MSKATKLSPRSPVRVLLVDDELLLLDVLSVLLQLHSYVVETASDGPEALKKLAIETVDVVLTDFAMPGMKGDQLAAAIKMRWPGLPVILFSAYGDMFKAEGKLLPNIDLVVSKPCTIDTLVKALVAVVGQARTGTGEIISQPPLNQPLDLRHIAE